MNEIIKKIEAEQLKAEVPQFHVGDTVKVYGKIKEGNRERIQVFEGVVLKRQGGGNRETFTVRKTSNGIGVEKTWPLHSPNVEKVEVVRRGKVRRAKLNYLRSRVGKAAGTYTQGIQSLFCSIRPAGNCRACVRKKSWMREVLYESRFAIYKRLFSEIKN